MTITASESKLLEQRETDLNQFERDIIEDTMNDLDTSMREQGLRPATDDRAARLEAALIRYVIESRPA